MMSERSALGAGLALVLLIAAAPAQNLLQNGNLSFWENPNQPTGWIVESLPLSTVEQESGTLRSAPYAAKMTRNVAGTGSNFGLKQFVEVGPAYQYTVSAWCYDDDPNARGGVVITWTRADSTSLGSTSPVYTDSAIHGWQQLTTTAMSPDSPSLRYAKVLMRVYGFTGGPAGGVVYYDDADFGLASIAEERSAIPQSVGFSVSPTLATGEIRAAITLPRGAEVSLSVYDLSGSLRVRVFSGRLAAGRHDLTVSASRAALLPDGLYFVVLDGASTRTLVRKLAIQH